jgi:hypothetical protein
LKDGTSQSFNSFVEFDFIIESAVKANDTNVLFSGTLLSFNESCGTI